MTIKELTLIWKPLKRNSDGKIRTKKPDLIAKYNEWNGRPVTIFGTSNIDSIPITTDKCDNDIDINIDNMDIENNDDL